MGNITSIYNNNIYKSSTVWVSLPLDLTSPLLSYYILYILKKPSFFLRNKTNFCYSETNIHDYPIALCGNTSEEIWSVKSQYKEMLHFQFLAQSLYIA